MKRLLFICLTLLPLTDALAFCGFYVGKADTSLFNQASQVAMMRDGSRTVLTMSSDFHGETSEFAMVVPVPTFIEKEQIHVTDRKIVEHLDHYSAPRLVEYSDPDPCQTVYPALSVMERKPEASMAKSARAEALGVTIEASYTVGEYDILILSAKQSDGLVTWLQESGYKIPAGAEAVVGSYLKQNMRFFVAKVNLTEQAKLGYAYLRPLQVAYESPKFMLPIRLGTVNANGFQELFIYTLTRKGRVETTNYRTVKLPSNLDVPVFIKNEFGPFYKALFNHQTEQQNNQAVFMEYAWDMGWCDPCAAEPLSPQELRELGVYWLSKDQSQRMPRGGAVDVFLTRLHVRYDRDHFPEDLQFQETGDRSNFQGRYILRHAFKGEANCEAAKQYFNQILPQRMEQELDNLVSLTGWDREQQKQKMDFPPTVPVDNSPWWKGLWSE